jgi:EAL domain-containing protein (putative c-di-GMP-specific phosphodiesterase class I)/FixJ family two-component response regulator
MTTRGAGQSVLVLEDEPLQQLLAQRLLESVGATHVQVCGEGETALRYLSRHRVDVILCDLNMPTIDGVTLVKALRERAPQAALVLMSSVGEKVLHSTEILARKYGSAFVASLLKPLTEEALSAVLQSARAHIARLTEMPADEPAVLPELDLLERALDEQRFVARYEPIIHATRGEIVSAEALTRLADGEGGWLFPSSFVASMEDSGLIDRLTKLMIEHVLGDLVKMHALGITISVSVNVSARSLQQAGFADAVFEALDRYQLTSADIGFELTETQRAADSPVALENLIRLHLHGHRLSIDDFGTGYSSILRLSEIPFSELKIDREFVHQSSLRAEMRTMVESSVALAQKLGLHTCAEGIETPEQLRYLLGLGVTSCQGWLFSQAVDLHGLQELIRRYAGGTAFRRLSERPV